MRSVSLRLLLLVCVATLLRSDACQAQDLSSLTPRELAVALLVHLNPSSVETVRASASPLRVPEAGSLALRFVALEPCGAGPDALTAYFRGQRLAGLRPVFQAVRRHERFMARSSLASAPPLA